MITFVYCTAFSTDIRELKYLSAEVQTQQQHQPIKQPSLTLNNKSSISYDATQFNIYKGGRVGNRLTSVPLKKHLVNHKVVDVHTKLTRTFTQSINFQKRNVETEKELQSISLDRSGCYHTVRTTVESKRLTNRLKDQVISQRPTIRNDSTTIPNTMLMLAFLLRFANM